ncbi:uncharacterized protein LOC9653762 [Selaginella moellendorffii]|uniref:uncharacterized protein LOC9653762 n=1 Tax=Selaginella moellendorffii TaxID=88036 RepID=UPI000D1CD582|nr:uncharacterized protein LOC9653762 [Selaginella moellendorffii]|eukprot:XP_024539060.1 uncharacterized protein LOC9653762 [Selaginella moellendorffii]
MRRKTHARWRVGALVVIAALVVFLVWLKSRVASSIRRQEEAADPSGFPGFSVEIKPKLAFLFLARNRMPLDFLWQRFFEGAKDHEFSVYIHARPGFVYNKETTDCIYFYNRQLPNSILVEWGEASMIEAERLLLAKAFEDSSNERFLLLSESCVPLYSFTFIYEYLMASPKSFVDSFRDRKENRYNPVMAPVISRANWRKGSQWFVLLRKHAEAVARDQEIFLRFRDHCKRGALPEFWREYSVSAYRQSGRNCVPDEHYIQTVLSIKGFDDELERRSLTYSLWKYAGRRRERQGWHPVTFSDASMKLVREIQAIDNIKFETEGRVEWCSVAGDPRACFLFGRKFTKAAGLKLLNMTLADDPDSMHLYHDKTRKKLPLVQSS